MNRDHPPEEVYWNLTVSQLVLDNKLARELTLFV